MPTDRAADVPTVLVVDDDPDIRDLVELSLRAAGHEVHTAEDGERGLAAAGDVRPDLIITDVLMPQFDGWAFVRALRSQPETALIPVIFMTSLGSREDHLRGFRLGADDYLPKPFEAEELVLRTRRVLERQSEVTAAPIASVGLSGDLEQVGVSSVLVLVEMERRSGTLTLRSDEETARIRFVDGSVCSAEVEDRDTGEEAVYRALLWSRGEFTFEEVAIEADGPVMNTTQLLLEGARRADEKNRPAPTAEVPVGIGPIQA